MSDSVLESLVWYTSVQVSLPTTKISRIPQSPVDDVSPDGPTKQGYKHHPKPNRNVPGRPYYVLFSNHTHEYLEAHTLTFTDLSEIIGGRWQALS